MGRRAHASASGGNTPRGSSPPGSSNAPSSSGSRCGFTGQVLDGRAESGRTGVSPTPEDGKTQDMMVQGYLPVQDYTGIMALSKELREHNKQLRSELVTVRVEHERLMAEDDFLRQSALRSGITPPPEVLRKPPDRPQSPWT